MSIFVFYQDDLGPSYTDLSCSKRSVSKNKHLVSDSPMVMFGHLNYDESHILTTSKNF